ELHIPGLSRPGLAEELRALEERHAHYTPVLRFTLLDHKQRRFGSERMCYLGSIDGWLELHRQTGPVAELARALIPTLGTEQFYEPWTAEGWCGQGASCMPRSRARWRRWTTRSRPG